MSERLEMFIDGACSGNPGEAAVGVVIYDENRQKIKEISKSIGVATNNIAEYSALVYALQEALILQAKELHVTTDSELLCKQVLGQYKVKEEHLKLLFDQVKHLISGFKKFEIKHVLREHNKEADKLASGAIKKQAKTVAPLFTV